MPARPLASYYCKFVAIYYTVRNSPELGMQWAQSHLARLCRARQRHSGNGSFEAES